MIEHKSKKKKKILLFLTTCLLTSSCLVLKVQASSTAGDAPIDISYKRIFSRSPKLTLKEQIIACLKDFDTLLQRDFQERAASRLREENLNLTSTWVRYSQKRIGNFLRWGGDCLRADDTSQSLFYQFLTPKISILFYNHPLVMEEMRKGGAAFARTLGAYMAGGESLSLVRTIADMRWSIGKNADEDDFWKTVKEALSEKYQESGLFDKYRLEDVTDKQISHLIDDAKKKIARRSSISKCQ